MFDAIVQKLRSASHHGSGRNRASILLPFLIISLGLGVLAWRSYNLSARAERGVRTLAMQYSGYAAEITASRIDAAVRAEMASVSDEWQQMERRMDDPTFRALSDWISHHDWITEAIYVPDFDPASAIYVLDAAKDPKVVYLTREFFTSTGMIRYEYDPRRLLTVPRVRSAIRQELAPEVSRTGETLRIQQTADVSIVANQAPGFGEFPGGFYAVSPLAAPVGPFAVRAAVQTSYVGGTGWENQRVMSLWVSLLALILLGIGAALALRGISKETETMKLRGALIANVSHELRTPLSMIRLGAETLKRGRLKESERQDIEDQILREVLLLSHLVENVLDVARIQNQSSRALAFSPVHPRELISSLLTTYESWIRSKGFTCDVQIDETVGEQMWDRDAVSRALLNLVDNAIKYSADEKAIQVILRQTPEYVVIEVKDRGIGIGGSDVSRVFDPYYRAQFSDTTTRRGAGLGLTLVQQILESHGGKVEVESEAGTGSTFRLMFPTALAGDPASVPSLSRPREAF